MRGNLGGRDKIAEKYLHNPTKFDPFGNSKFKSTSTED